MANKKEENKNVVKKTPKKGTTKKTTTKKTNIKEEVVKEDINNTGEVSSTPKKSTTFTIIILAAIIVCLVALFIPNKNSDSTTSSNLELTPLTCDNATDSIEQDEDSNLNKISCNGYQSLVSEAEDNLILIARPTCAYCVKFVPVLEEIVDEYGIVINYFDIDTLSDNENSQFYESSSLFSSSDFGTPTLIVTNNNEIKKYSIGYKEKSATVDWLKENGIINE